MIIKRGEIWLANLNPTIGSEIKKTRPVVIVSNDANNQYNETVTVLPVTSNTFKVFSFEVFLPKKTGNLPKDSKAKADQIRTLDKSRLIKAIGILPYFEMEAIAAVIKLHLDL